MKAEIKEFWELSRYEAKKAPLYVAFNTAMMLCATCVVFYTLYLLFSVI